MIDSTGVGQSRLASLLSRLIMVAALPVLLAGLLAGRIRLSRLGRPPGRIGWKSSGDDSLPSLPRVDGYVIRDVDPKLHHPAADVNDRHFEQPIEPAGSANHNRFMTLPT
jgi:hypothetical protein